MKNILKELYTIVKERVSVSQAYRAKLRLARAKLALLDELEPEECERIKALLDAYGALDAEREILHGRALFQAALGLGRLGPDRAAHLLRQ